MLKSFHQILMVRLPRRLASTGRRAAPQIDCGEVFIYGFSAIHTYQKPQPALLAMLRSRPDETGSFALSGGYFSIKVKEG
jgi:hypothetical protein